MIKQNLAQIQQQINQLNLQYSNQTKLIAVSKTKPNDDILTAFNLGQLDFGENYVQEAITKIDYFNQKNIKLNWHFIGNLQSNKAKLVAQKFNWVQTVDSLKLAQKLSQNRPDNMEDLNILIQVNISDQTSKSGIKPSEIKTLADAIVQLPKIKLRGLMTIPNNLNNQQIEQDFSHMNQLYLELKQLYPNIDTLSMGMSDDMDLAIKHGATMVRIGSAIFGARS